MNCQNNFEITKKIKNQRHTSLMKSKSFINPMQKMKTKYIFSCLILLLAGIAKGQIVPHGVTYQGIARDISGEVIANKTITLLVNLDDNEGANSTLFFSEIHRLTTSASGQFKIVIGKGSTLAGSFYHVPWSSKHIWMDIQYKKDGAPEFTMLNRSEMLAVPYAFHAGTATALTGDYLPYNIPGTVSSSANTINSSPATSWLTPGNSSSTPPLEYIGTNDLKDLVIKTTSVERMRIYSNGNININNTLTIGNDLTVNRDATIYRNILVKRNAIVDSNLTVKRIVNLNALIGSTINYGPFNVGNISPSIMKGTLRVDRTSTLNNGLNVNNNKPTLLTGTLRVNNATDLYDSFTVNVQAPSVLTGTLRVDSNVTFKNRLFLTNSGFNSFNTSNGNLVVYGGVGIGRNLFVGGDAKVSGQATLNGQVKITDTRISERQDSGALVVTGGVGIGKELKVRGAVHLFDSLRVNKTAYINDALTVTDSVNITSAASNALIVNNATTFNNYLDVNNQMTINTPSLSGANGTTAANYPLRVQGGMQGIAIRVSGSKANANNFASFWDNSSMQGRIEGFTNSEYINSSDYIEKHNRLIGARNLNALMFSVAVVRSVVEGNTLAGAVGSSTGCFGLGACVTAPIPSLIAGGVANFAASLVFIVTSELQLINAQTALSNFESAAANVTGVTYESGAGDYAEFLEMADPSESISPGDIVGMKNGKISKNTAGADKQMVISVNPIVLGNTPSAEKEKLFKKVAFLGQVPVKVVGKVNVGDYILADGNNLGMGVAKHPSRITVSDEKNIVGIAWENSPEGSIFSTVNVAVGLNKNDNINQVATLEADINSLQSRLEERNKKLAKLLPAFKEEIEKPSFTMLVNDPSALKNSKSSDNVIYYNLSREQVEAGLSIVEQDLKESGKELEKVPGFQNFKSNPEVKERIINHIFTRISELQSRQKAIDMANRK
jgi:hypothetical protein